MISPYVRQENTAFIVAENLSPEERQVALIMEVFDLQPGQRLTSISSLNEFLSALVMCKQIGGLVSERDLLRIALCIEATIPFRPFTADGKSHFDVMETRLPGICERFGIELSPEEQIAAIKTAVLFANKDIENFGEADPARFLDNTWNLLPETNAALRMPDVYSISTYRQALSKMDAFFENLDPNTVFNQYRGLPSDEEYRAAHPLRPQQHPHRARIPAHQNPCHLHHRSAGKSHRRRCPALALPGRPAARRHKHQTAGILPARN